MLKFEAICQTDIGYETVYGVYGPNGVYCGELYPEVDGYYVWWSTPRGGFLQAWFLREIADKLDELNAAWHAQVNADMELLSHNSDDDSSSGTDQSNPGS